MKTDTTAKGVFMLLVAALSWGGMFPVAKAALSSLDGFHLSAVRYGVASLIFLVILTGVEGRRSLSLEGRGLKIFLFGSAGFAGFSILAFVGLSYSRAEHGAIIMAMMPLITALINWVFRGMPPSRTTVTCIGTALAGVLLVITKGNLGSLAGGGSVFGDILILLGATCWVIYTIGASVAASGWSPLRYTTLSSTLGTLTIFVATVIATNMGYINAPSVGTLGSVGFEMSYLVVIAAVIAVLCWNAGIKILGPLNGILFINLVPITAFSIGLAQGHEFSTAEIAGAAITIAALVANNISVRQASARAAARVAASRA